MDEGVYSGDFVLIEAPSKLAISQHILQHPDRWAVFLHHAYPRKYETAEASGLGSLMDIIQNQQVTPEEFLVLIEQTYVDGDSGSQLRIHPVSITPLEAVRIRGG